MIPVMTSRNDYLKLEPANFGGGLNYYISNIQGVQVFGSCIGPTPLATPEPAALSVFAFGVVTVGAGLLRLRQR